MRLAPLMIMIAALAMPVNAEQATIAAPKAHLPKYDPKLSAKEAVLANWDLAASGIRAGQVVGRRVVDMAEKGAPYPALARLAAQAEKTMVQRWNAAQWVYVGEPELARMQQDVLQDAVDAAAAPCAAEPCTDETEALRAAFAQATVQMGDAAAETRDAIRDRMARQDAVLMTEQLDVIATYLESGEWSRDFALAHMDREREEVAARLVGAMSIWRNVEPYVGLTDPEIDAAINQAAEQLLRTLRLGTRGEGPLTQDGSELTALRERADILAAEFRRAAALFAA